MSNEKIAETLGIDFEADNLPVAKPDDDDSAYEPDEVDAETDALAEILPPDPELKDIETDYQFTRNKMKSIIEKGEEALDGIIALTNEAGSARSYEVVAKLLDTMGSLNKQLFDLQKTNRDVRTSVNAGLIGKGSNIQVQQGVVFAGDSATMLARLKEKQKELREIREKDYKDD